MAKYFTDADLLELLKLPEDAAVAEAKKRFPKMFDTAAAVAEVKAAYARRAAPLTSDLEQALGSFGLPTAVGAGAAGVAVSRLAELVKGTTITYEAVLRREEIAARLRTALAGDFGVRESEEEVVISRVDRMGEIFCRIRVSVSGNQTTVVTSGLNLAANRKTGGGLLDGLVGVGRDVLARQGLDSVLDFVTDTALAAAEVGSDLWVANQMASAIETYGAEQERRANTVRSAAQAKAARIVEIEGLLGSCQSCGRKFPEDGSDNCEHCGAATEVTALRAELARLQKS